jgi:antitoxin (DNA-binding transcriptional repressor) of toxin-antitoxin stability system
MTEIGIRELRTTLATVVRRAGAGERTVVSVGGRPVAQLGPLDTPGRSGTFADLVARGWIEPPRRTTPGRPSDAVAVWRGARLDRLLAEIRG